MKKYVNVFLVILSLLILFIVAPAFVSAKSTVSVFIGFVLTAFSVSSLYFVVSNFIKKRI